MKRTLLLIIASLLFHWAGAQQIFKTGGTSNSTFLLGNTLAQHTQSLYFPADLTNAQSGDIIRLYYRYGTSGQGAVNDVSGLVIKMWQSTATSFVANTYYTALATVYNADLPIPVGVSGEWFSIDLGVPFAYDAALTLIIDIQFDSTTVNTFGCLGGPNNGVKLYSGNLTDLMGNPGSSTLQDVGFDLDPVAGVPDGQQADHGLILRPNPANDQVVLTWSGNNMSQAIIYDHTGREVRHVVVNGLEQVTVDVRDMPAGAYFVQMVSENNDRSVQKLIKLDR